MDFENCVKEMYILSYTMIRYLLYGHKVLNVKLKKKIIK